MDSKGKEFVKQELLRIEHRVYSASIIVNIITYVLITFWLNSIRQHWPIWSVWTLIVIQLILYINFFLKSGLRARTIGLNGYWWVVFAILALLGRVNDWEIVILPLVVIVTILLSSKTKHITENKKYILEKGI